MRKLILTTALVFAFSKADAQPFVEKLPILKDSVEICLSGGYFDFGGIRPLKHQCLCLETPALEYKGKVLVEFVDSTSKNFVTFYGYYQYQDSTITSCFFTRELVWDSDSEKMFYESNGHKTEMKARVREPSDKLFREP
jgi:hypothetical protein